MALLLVAEGVIIIICIILAGEDCGIRNLVNVFSRRPKLPIIREMPKVLGMNLDLMMSNPNEDI
jgi:hypothetical protein